MDVLSYNIYDGFYFCIDFTLSLQGTTWSEGIKFASCCVAFAPCTPGTCRSSALYLAQILCLLTLESSNKKDFFIFKANQESVTYEYAD